MTDNEKYLEFAKELAVRAGEIMQEHFQIGVDKEIKEDHSPLTIADTAINDMVVDEVRKTYPDHDIKGEEASFANDPNKTAKYVWSCDPIDGTIPFSMGIHTSMFSLALVEDGTPVVGVLFDPYHDRMFTAIKGGGAFLNGESISVSDKADLHMAAVVVEGPRDKSRKLSHFKGLWEGDARIFSYKCITLPFAMLAAGQFDAVIFDLPMAHDVTAAKVIIEEAGGTTTDFQGNDQRYDQPTNGFVATNGHLHEEVLKILNP